MFGKQRQQPFQGGSCGAGVEAGKDQVGRGGIVRDPAVHASVVGSFCLWAIGMGLQLLGVRPSPIEGGDGNREFFVLLRA